MGSGFFLQFKIYNCKIIVETNKRKQIQKSHSQFNKGSLQHN